MNANPSERKMLGSPRSPGALRAAVLWPALAREELGLWKEYGASQHSTETRLGAVAEGKIDCKCTKDSKMKKDTGLGQKEGKLHQMEGVTHLRGVGVKHVKACVRRRGYNDENEEKTCREQQAD